jgi:hypothetical protein
MPRFRYDRDLDRLVEIHERSNYFEASSGPAVISDIEPYRAMGADVACGGKRPMIQSRSDHRDYLSRNGYVEVGNEKPMAPLHGPSEREMQAARVDDIKRASGEHGSNTGADYARWMRDNRGVR